MSEAPKSTSKALTAAGSIVGLLPQIAAAAAGAAILGLLAGWRDASAYFGSIGAPWFASALTPSMLIERVASLLMLLGLFAFLSVYNLSLSKATAKGLRRYSIALVVLAALLFGVPLLAPDWIGKRVVYYCAVGAALASAMSAGLTIGEAVARLVDDDLAWGGHHVWLLYLAVFFGLIQAPGYTGSAKAKLDLDTKQSTLPVVELASGASAKAWRLVAVAGTQFLLVSAADAAAAPAFRVVEAAAIAEIRSSLSQ
jgi:hypothetical protein